MRQAQVPRVAAENGLGREQISRVLKGCDILPDDQRTGRAAGIACAASATGVKIRLFPT